MQYSFGQRLALGAFSSLATGVFGFTTRYLRHSCRWHLRGPLHKKLESDDQVILSSWHQDVLPLFHYMVTYTSFERRRRFVMLASRSFDGEVTERIMRPWGFRFVRGSRGKAGARSALRGLRRALDEGKSVVVVGDGPRPPPYVMRPGAAYLSRKTGVPLYVARAWSRPQILLARTWFRMAVPLPRAHIAVFSSGPVDVSGELEDARVRAQDTLNRLCEEADAHLYLRPRISGGIRLGARPV